MTIDNLIIEDVPGKNIMVARPVHDYLSEIGRRGGQKSRRTLDPTQAREMANRRWERVKQAMKRPTKGELLD